MEKLDVHRAGKNSKLNKCPHCGSTEGFKIVGCGKARERVIKKGKLIATREDAHISTGSRGPMVKGNPKRGFAYENKTIGWTKCDCKPQEYEAGIVLDPFIGSGTTAVVAKKLGRNYCGIELNKDYIKIAEQRIRGQIRAML